MEDFAVQLWFTKILLSACLVHTKLYKIIRFNTSDLVGVTIRDFSEANGKKFLTKRWRCQFTFFRKMRSKFEKIHDENDTVLLEDPIQVRKVVHDYFQSWKM